MSWPLFDFSSAPPYQQKLDYDGGNQVVYLGWATPGVAITDAKWKIRKFTYAADSDGNLQVTAIQFANGDVGFNQIWDKRVSLSYS